MPKQKPRVRPPSPEGDSESRPPRDDGRRRDAPQHACAKQTRGHGTDDALTDVQLPLSSARLSEILHNARPALRQAVAPMLGLRNGLDVLVERAVANFRAEADVVHYFTEHEA